MGGRRSNYYGTKYYAVAVGRTVGVFVDDWEACQDSVSGYSGNVYRAFRHPYDAMDFVLRGPDAYIVSRQYDQYEGRHSQAQAAKEEEQRQQQLRQQQLRQQQQRQQQQQQQRSVPTFHTGFAVMMR